MMSEEINRLNSASTKKLIKEPVVVKVQKPRVSKDHHKAVNEALKIENQILVKAKEEKQNLNK